MSMVAITGLQGSGKSHQAIKYIIVPNFAAGRTIRTNIKGINLEALIEYCKKEYPSSLVEDFGKIITITDKDISQKNFYPTLEEVDNKEVMNDTDSIIKSGDVIVIDEAAQFYSSVTEAMIVFFTMHRHFTDSKGLSSEICFLVQDLSLISIKARKILKTTYVCKKLDVVGFSGRYFLGIYDGSRINSKYMINSKNEPYDKEIFKLYSSHAAGTGKEKKLDRRANIFSSWKAWILIAAVIIAPIFLIWTLWKFTHPDSDKLQITDKNAKSSGSLNSATPVQNQNSNEQNFKIVGVLDTPGKRIIFLQDQFKNVKTIFPQSCTGSGILMICKYENKEVSYMNNSQGQNNEKTINIPNPTTSSIIK